MLATTVKISENGKVIIPSNICDSFHWTDGMELMLVATESGVMLMSQTQQKIT